MKNNDQDNALINHLARLKWACRRGMLELDVLLNNFLQEAYPQLSDADKHRFVQLLASDDPTLFAWLMNQSTPDDPELAAIVNRIRQHAQSRL